MLASLTYLLAKSCKSQAMIYFLLDDLFNIKNIPIHLIDIFTNSHSSTIIPKSPHDIILVSEFLWKKNH